MLTGENGILSQAQRAKNETENAAQNEVAILDEYNNTLNNWINEGTVTIPEGLEIGTTVAYSPNGTYNWQSKYYYYTSSNNPNITLDSNTNAEFNINTWKVLDINKETGEILLIPEVPTSGKVTLGGAQGYNNAVFLLNDACKNLYSDGSKGIVARSINIDDIERYMTEEALNGENGVHKYTYEGTQYNNKVLNAYLKDNSYYPNIYTKENKSIIDENENTSGLEMSEQTDLIEPTNETSSDNGYVQAETSIQPYQTYWRKEDIFIQTAFKNVENNSKVSNYYNLIMPSGTSTSYWIASRCIDVHSTNCNFRIRNIDNGNVGASIMCNSFGNGGSYSLALFPVVSLNSELITGNTTTGFSVK